MLELDAAQVAGIARDVSQRQAAVPKLGHGVQRSALMLALFAPCAHATTPAPPGEVGAAEAKSPCGPDSCFGELNGRPGPGAAAPQTTFFPAWPPAGVSAQAATVPPPGAIAMAGRSYVSLVSLCSVRATPKRPAGLLVATLTR